MDFEEYAQRIAAARFRNHDAFYNDVQNAFVNRKIENAERISVNDIYNYKEEEQKLWNSVLKKRNKTNNVDELQELHVRAERAKKIVEEVKKRGEL